MTRRLYYEDPYIKEFYGSIISVEEKENGVHIQLDQTAFYPEGGGQPCDLGIIGDAAVSLTYEENGKVVHVTDKIPNYTEKVPCRIDWNRRFDHMQQHLGQHILSAVCAEIFHADTVGFHIGSTNVTIDINKVLELKDIEKLESLTNQKVFENKQVDAFYPSQEEFQTLSLRKLPQVKTGIRIVRIEGVDVNACCGTHPARTGEVGIIKVIRWEKYKGGLRIEFACGVRALRDYSWKNDAINILAISLGCKDLDVVQKLNVLNDKLAKIHKENSELKDKILDIEARELFAASGKENNISIIQAIFSNRDLEEVRLLASKITVLDSAVVLFGIKNQENAQILFCRSKELNHISARELFKESVALLDGKGGGTDLMAQGGGPSIENLETALELACTKLKIAFGE
ncbi:MAG: DHHA1 domain-containing protein [Clostridia bacterium]|nr:DHHA1 domain-containing protein [Clostridia bacterium]